MCFPGAHDSFCSSGVFKKILNNFLEFTFFFYLCFEDKSFFKMLFFVHFISFYSFKPNSRRIKQNARKEKLSRFLKMGGCF